MFGIVHSWFAPGANPIGIDFGTDALRMAQVEEIASTGEQKDFRLVAAARAEVPPNIRNDPSARQAFFVESLKGLWSRGNFRGRRATLALPAACMSIQHLRVPKMDDDAIRKALPWEARGKLPYDPTQALLRHIVAGEIHQDGEQRNEVILLAAARETVDQLLAAAAKARLDVIGMNVEPKSIIDCFCHVFRRQTDSDLTNLFVDVGVSATRAYIARGQRILCARAVPVGADHFNRAVATAFKISTEEARAIRMQAAAAAPVGLPPTRMPMDTAEENRISDVRNTGPAMPVCPEPTTEPPATVDASRINDACCDTVVKLVEELALCRRYHEATFPTFPVDRLIFIGGEARNRAFCQAIARGLNLAAQVGDPMVRMGRLSELGPETGIDRRLPQPDWAVAIGLSMGPIGAGVPVEVR